MPSQKWVNSHPEGLKTHLENPTDVSHTVSFVTHLLTTASVCAFMLLRCYVKAFITPPFNVDDLYRFGGGFHIYEISQADFVNFSELQALYVHTLIYSLTSYFTKLALLLVNTRIFRADRTTVLRTYVLIILTTGYHMPTFAIKANICQPINGFWDLTIKTSCFNRQAIFFADTAISVITNLAILYIPIPVVLALRIPWSKRLKIIAMLNLGGIAIVASMVRMILGISLRKLYDEPVDIIRLSLFSTADVSIGIICTCLPAVNILITHWYNSKPVSTRGGRAYFCPVEFRH
ncbi:uncharacterized protein CTRU02_202813 [Colletotrichum truncatum]|uniref:Integral membrane protein n=1 Tax=Colletotrichum truncatum TaxID=5467 RepID=A0ACC3ZLF7_COLTU